MKRDYRKDKTLNKIPEKYIKDTGAYHDKLKDRNRKKQGNNKRNRELRRGYQSTHMGRIPKIVDGVIQDKEYRQKQKDKGLFNV